VLVATTLGAVAGPNLVSLTGSLAADAGTPALAGPFVLATLAYGLGATVLTGSLRPDPPPAARTRWPRHREGRAPPRSPPPRSPPARRELHPMLLRGARQERAATGPP